MCVWAFGLQVDQKNEAVLLPIYGLLVPFHIATVKSVSSQQDGGHSYIRIIFNVPGAGYGPNDVPTQKFPRSIYVKEVSFRSNDTRHSYQVVQLIKTLRRQVAQRESERAERATLVTQERLQIGKGRPIRYMGDGMGTGIADLVFCSFASGVVHSILRMLVGLEDVGGNGFGRLRSV